MEPIAVRVAGATTLLVAAVLSCAPPSRHDPAPLESSASRLGLRVELRLDRSAVTLGERVNAVATVTNETAAPMAVHGTYGCDVHVDLRDQQPPGEEQTGVAAEFKARALRFAPLSFSFVSDEHPSTGCSTEDVHHSRDIAPGASLRVPVWWDARTPLGMAYGGTATVRARFYVDDGLGAFPGEDDLVVTTLPLSVSGGSPGIVAPAVAVDTALGVPEFRAYVESHPPSTWPEHRPRVATVTAEPGAWRVTLQLAQNTEGAYVVVDARTGGVLRKAVPE